MKKANLFIIGAQKCGTTAFAQYLNEHIDVSVLHVKESQLFSWKLDKDPNFDIDAYHNQEFKTEAPLMVDASTTYTFYGVGQRAVKRILQYNPDARFIFIVKDPVERIVSHYTHLLVRGQKLPPINQAVFNDHLINNSQYYSCILPFWESVNAKNLLILDFKNLVKLEDEVMTKLETFLGISLKEHTTFPNANRGAKQTVTTYRYRMAKKYVLRFFPERVQLFIKRRFFQNSINTKPEISKATREALQQELAQEMTKFYELTGIDYRV